MSVGVFYEVERQRTVERQRKLKAQRRTRVLWLKTHRTGLNGNETQSYKMYLGTSNETLPGR